MTGHIGRDESCPARGKACNKCGIVGHFAACCRTKAPKKTSKEKRRDGANQAGEKSDESETDHYAFIVKDCGNIKSNGIVDLVVGNAELKNILFDSGASCNVMDRAAWENMKQKGVKCKSQKSEKKLFAYRQTEPIEVLVTFECDIYCNDSGVHCVEEFTVIEGSGKALLGKETAEKLNVLRVGPPDSPKVYSVTNEDCDKDILMDFEDVFSRVGKLKDFQMKLHIKDDNKPVAQPVRRLSFGLRGKLDKKLDELLAEDIIEEVPNGPTDWISPLVVVPKPDGDVRLCIDMRRANEAIERERHPIPTIEEVLYELNWSTVYNKLDLKWGFHQVELEESSRFIDTSG